ncbi:MAG: hypothetical protein AABY32_06470 [Nanoarchaeota archaeon]
MGIFSFLKKIFSEPEKTEPIREKIAFSDIENFIKNKIDETNAKEKGAISLIKEKITAFASELKEKIKLVHKVDIDSKEKNDKIKSATNEGRKKYIEFLERFIDTLESLEETKLEKITENINLAFTRFNESSSKSYERATILIGKEMGDIRETLKNFSTELITLFNENKEVIIISKRLSLIESKVSEVKEARGKSQKISAEILALTNKSLEKEKESKEISNNIDKIKNRSEYIENIEKEKAIKLQEEQLETEMLNLKQLIDFKALSNFFHIFEDRMAIVKLYRDNFLFEFKSDKGSRLLNLLNESKLNTEQIYDKIKQIQDKEEEIEHNKNTLKKDETQTLSSELDKINQEVQGFMNEIGWAEKKNEKLKISQNEILKLIKDELDLLDVDLED